MEADAWKPDRMLADGKPVQPDAGGVDHGAVPMPDGSALDLGPQDSNAASDTFPPPAPDSCIKSTSAGHHVYKCDGLAFDVEVPGKCLIASCGLVVDVHGLTMNAKMQDNNTNMRALGVKYGYIVIQPNANGGPPLTAWTAADDAKVAAFIKRVVKVWHVDPKRVHFTGFSQGGSMSWRFLCTYGNLLASVAPAASCQAVLSSCLAKGKQPKHRVPILYMHGTKDVLASFACSKQVRDALVSTWKLTSTKVVSQSSSHQHTRYANAKGDLFELLRHDYVAKSLVIAGHCYPGSNDLNGGVSGQLFGFACAGKNAFSWGEEAIKFFIAHPRK